MKNWPKKIEIFEVGPRDGLQNEKKILTLDAKVEFIYNLIDAGFKQLEVTSFVNPKKIPQMSDAKELFLKVRDLCFKNNVNAYVLVPNMKGLENALEVGVKHIALFTATSETFNKKNIDVSIDESFIRIKEVIKNAGKMTYRGYISTVFGCPYEGAIPVTKVIEVIKKFLDLGVNEISLGDTIGIAHPMQVQVMLTEILKVIPASKLALHFHDTRGLALANCLTALDFGIEKFDSSAGGLGGCPYAKGASGNLATEDLVYFANQSGIVSGINLKKLVHSSKLIHQQLEKKSVSKIVQLEN